MSDIDRALLHITQNRTLDRAIEALAGYRAGIHDVKGFQILVRRGPRLIEPEEGEFMLIENLLAGRLIPDDGDRTQFDRFNYWMQRAVEGIYGDAQLNTQVLILAGPAGSAKSRLQHMILTPLLGGRSGDPSRYVFGETTFNETWMGCEHLLIEDPRPSMKPHDRLQFAQILKSLTVNEEQSLHGKGKPEFGTKARFAVSISINDDPDSLRILPPLTPDFRDKVMMFRVHKRELPMPTRTPAERKAFADAVADELPAYLFWLLNVCKVPDEIASDRFGVLHYQDPELAAALWEDTPSGELLAPIDGTDILDGQEHPVSLFEARGSRDAREALKDPEFQSESAARRFLRSSAASLRRVWIGASKDLQDVLERSRHRSAALKLIGHNAVARMLGRLAEDRPDRVANFRRRNRRFWIIASPDPIRPKEKEPEF